MSKGDTPRPKAITEDDFGDRWVKTFCPPDRPVTRAGDQIGLQRVVEQQRLRQSCTDWPPSDPLTHPDTED